MVSRSRRIAGVLASLATAATMLIAPASASAQLSSQLGLPDVTEQGEQLSSQLGVSQQDVRDQAWAARVAVHETAGMLPGPAAGQVRGIVDDVVHMAFPGLVAERTQAARPAPAPARASDPAPVFDRGSCPRSADVCVDLDGQRTWLQENGEVSYGPVPSSSGGIGQETPRGSFPVNRKVRHEVSWEFNNAPMPYAIYFTYNGHAFHQGNVATTSAGCVRLNQQDAAHYFANVHIGDTVHIY